MQIPAILDRIASAGPAGLALQNESAGRRDLDLCRAWRFPVEIDKDTARIDHNPDTLVPVWIESEARSMAWKNVRVRGFLEIGSTNDEALARALAGAPEGTLIYAERQTAGRGRMGRSWLSAAGAGLYFSLLLRPVQPLRPWPVLTHVASIALFRALHDLRTQRLVPDDLALDLKWPNDVLLSGKKVAGILLETVFRGDAAVAAVVGVGVNVAADSIPADLSSVATAIAHEAGVAIPRRWLLIRFLIHFRVCYQLFGAARFGEIIEQWKNCSTMWDGTEVMVTDASGVRTAVTCGLTDLGALKVRTEGGSEETLLAGDVSIRRR